MERNTLYYGDNLDVLRRYIDDESVDLVYLDPPFKSGQDYNVLFAEQNGSRSAAQIKAFEDTWRWDEAALRAYEETVDAGGRVSEALQAFRRFLGENEMMAYLAMMAPRLVELRRVLKPTGSLYLHCDPAASHYLKMLLDAIFGAKSFLNEIIWHYRKWPSGKYTYQRNHDTIFFYARQTTRARVFNQLYMERAASTLKRFGNAKIISGHDEKGRRVPSRTGDDPSVGVRQDDVWDIGRVPPIKQLFPTQKPELLLERIIRASSNEGGNVLDPFCGCGTTVVSAQMLKRRWIGIDITHLATNLIKARLADAFGLEAGRDYDVVGEPLDITGGRALAAEDPYQFQYWVLGFVGARPADPKRGADRGIDGRRYFEAGKYQAIFSVKSGRVSVSDVRDLHGVVEREKATVGALLTLQPPTRPMIQEAMAAGMVDWHGVKYPRLQILTVEELFAGKKLQIHAIMADTTFKRAQRVRRKDRIDPIFPQDGFKPLEPMPDGEE